MVNQEDWAWSPRKRRCPPDRDLGGSEKHAFGAQAPGSGSERSGLKRMIGLPWALTFGNRQKVATEKSSPQVNFLPPAAPAAADVKSHDQGMHGSVIAGGRRRGSSSRSVAGAATSAAAAAPTPMLVERVSEKSTDTSSKQPPFPKGPGGPSSPTAKCAEPSTREETQAQQMPVSRRHDPGGPGRRQQH